MYVPELSEIVKSIDLRNRRLTLKTGVLLLRKKGESARDVMVAAQKAIIASNGTQMVYVTARPDLIRKTVEESLPNPADRAQYRENFINGTYAAVIRLLT